ncbi:MULTISPECIES: DUF134 domain-containing protein [Prosthecochloris]|uniref:UPF0251 protein FGF68_04870 n=1 Tax=Prosthecochloris vibrioformis TaxID=1098 RepID=A0A5C4S0F1_PROVB|nr:MULTISPECIES: DUF134 domain-containing protein [Prosthecochloris]ANT65023.1 hypothetical protein Ptc2401_01250 [Prosthecochloris sp. CIB 2401]TNJ36910.1 DUF134 domain-containing protein [Prosthecochloris vibrioformis]
MDRNRAGRPKSCRWVKNMPRVRCFKPQGVPGSDLEEVVLSVDEMESLRLADLDGLYQSEAAERMNVSRQTFGRIVDAARGKVADAIIHGKAIVIEGGVIMKNGGAEGDGQEVCACPKCKYEQPHDKGTPCRELRCPECGAVLVRKGGCGAGRRQQRDG